LKRQAESASVELPEKYAFSFQAQSTMLTFQNLEPLAVQLGEVKKICDIVIASKVNSLDGIRRQRMTTDDMSLQASTSDYLDLPATTNENSIIMPYEVRFRCFSPELADVLAGFANSPHGLIVKSIEVVHAPPGAGTDETGIMAVQPVYQAPPTQPNYPPRQFRPPPPTLRQRLGEEERMTYGTPVRQPVQRMAPVVVPPAGSTLQTFINEQQLQVTIIVNVIRFLPKP
jgi:hypothetical protein